MTAGTGTERATSAGTYDATLRGVNNYQADRELAARLLEICPELGGIARVNRDYLGATVLLAVAHLGITQFLDLGCGYPAPGGVLESVLAADDSTRVACVDCDPDIAGKYGHGPVLAERGERRARMVLADLARPEDVTGHPDMRGLIDFGRPVMCIFGAVLHYWRPEDGRRIVSGYMDRLPAGSAAAVTVVCNPDPAVHEAMRDAWTAGTGHDFVNLHSADDEAVASLFGDLSLLNPGAGPLSGVRHAGKACTRPYLAGGIAVKR